MVPDTIFSSTVTWSIWRLVAVWRAVVKHSLLVTEREREKKKPPLIIIIVVNSIKAGEQDGSRAAPGAGTCFGTEQSPQLCQPETRFPAGVDPLASPR